MKTMHNEVQAATPTASPSPFKWEKAEVSREEPRPPSILNDSTGATSHPSPLIPIPVEGRGNPSGRWWTVVIFAIAMAWVESAVVFYIRTMVDRIQPHQPDPLPLIGTLGPVELAREVATLIMHFTIGMLAGRTWRARLGYMAVSFGIWDVFYYVFLKIMCDWPKTLLDWDILFLLPLPWWGPVLSPMLIALLMIVWGTLASQFERLQLPAISEWRVWGLNSLGIALALYVFMADAIRVADQGVDVIRNVLPARFNWPLFCLALVLMAAPAVQLCRRTIERPKLADVE